MGGNILFTGVGGQGILLASELTARALLAAGFDVKKSEVHGMAQRGGSVEAHLRYGQKIYSPLIEPGTADVQLAFEILEAGRYLPFLRPGGTVIVNRQEIPPPAVALGQTAYPADVLDQVARRGVEVVEVDALALARELGEVRTANVVMVGALSRRMALEERFFTEAIDAVVKERFREVNQRALAAGRAAAA